MPNVTPPNGLQVIIGQAEPYGVFQQFLDSDGSWKWVRGPHGTVDLTWDPDGTITIATLGSAPQTIAIDLTSEQIATMESNPPVFVPAPGEGKILAFLSAYSLPIPGTIPFSSAYTYLAWEGSDDQLNDNTLYFAQVGSDPYWSQTPMNSTQWTPDVGPENTAIVAYITSSDDPSGAVLDFSIDAGGAGYTATDTASVDAFTDSIFVVDTVDGGGAVLTGHFESGGYNGTPGVGLSTTVLTGGGDGNLTITVSSITPANGTARLWITYQVLELPSA